MGNSDSDPDSLRFELSSEGGPSGLGFEHQAQSLRLPKVETFYQRHQPLLRRLGFKVRGSLPEGREGSSDFISGRILAQWSLWLLPQ